MTVTNYIKRGFSAAGEAFATCVSVSTQAFGRGMLKLNAAVSDPDVVQRICKSTALAIAAMAEVGCVPTALKSFSLEQYKVVLLSTDDGFNFFGFLRQPYNWLKPISAGLVDWDAARAELIAKLKSYLTSTHAANPLPAGDVDAFATACIEKLLKNMKNNVNYATPNEFKADLAELIKREMKTDGKYQQAFANFKLADADYKVPYRKASYLEWWTNISFTAVDLSCVPLYLKIWNLDPTPYLLGKLGGLAHSAAEAVNLGTQAKAIGETRLFKWASAQDLGNMVWGFCTAAFIFQFIEARRKLNDEKSTLKPWEKANAKVDVIAAATEAVYCGASFIQVQNLAFVYSLGVIAKLVGIYRLVNRQAPQLTKPTINAGA